MRLTVKIENFKSIGSADLTLDSGLNILIGPNGSGKTCLLTALKLIRDILIQGAGLAIARGGGPQRNYRRGSDEIRFTVDGGYRSRVYRRRQTAMTFRWALSIRQLEPENTSTVSTECVTIRSVDSPSNEKPVAEFRIERVPSGGPKTTVLIDDLAGADLFDRLPVGQAKSSKYRDVTEGVKKKSADASAAELEQSLLTLVAQYDSVFTEVLQTFLSLNEYNIIPDIARQSTDQLPFAIMEPNGRNVSEVIHALEHRHFHRLTTASRLQLDADRSRSTMLPFWFHFSFARSRLEPGILEHALERINSELSAAVDPIYDVTVETDQTNGRRFVVFRTQGSRSKFYPDEVSDGTIKWLCLLASIYVPFSSAYLLEEPENYLHPWMQQKLLQIMRQQADRTKTAYLLTSHSATVLNSMMPSEVTVVKAGPTGTTTTSITHKAEIESILGDTNFGLGDLWVNGLLGGVPTGSDSDDDGDAVEGR